MVVDENPKVIYMPVAGANDGDAVNFESIQARIKVGGTGDGWTVGSMYDILARK